MHTHTDTCTATNCEWAHAEYFGHDYPNGEFVTYPRRDQGSRTAVWTGPVSYRNSAGRDNRTYVTGHKRRDGAAATYYGLSCTCTPYGVIGAEISDFQWSDPVAEIGRRAYSHALTHLDQRDGAIYVVKNERRAVTLVTIHQDHVWQADEFRFVERWVEDKRTHAWSERLGWFKPLGTYTVPTRRDYERRDHLVAETMGVGYIALFEQLSENGSVFNYHRRTQRPQISYETFSRFEHTTRHGIVSGWF